MQYNGAMHKLRFTLAVLAGITVVTLTVITQSHHGGLEVSFFDVGQGDAIFIETPGGRQILIDGGPDDAILEKLGRAMPFWDRTIDWVVLTHPHSDHLIGLLEVLKRYRVANILWTGVNCDNALCNTWKELVEEESANVFIAEAGLKIEDGLVSADILYPFENLEAENMENLNNTSIVMRLNYGDDSFLFVGDAQKQVEKELMGRGALMDSDVLKVGHHGSKNASSPEFILAVSPEMAVISAGKDNSFGHPAAETLATYQEYGIKTLITNINGDIKIICNSQSSRQK